MNFKFFTFIYSLILVYGWTYCVPSTVSSAVDIPSTKIPGTVILVLDDNVKNVSQEVKTPNYFCFWRKFLASLDSSLALSVKKTTDAIFENVVEQSNLPKEDPFLQMGGKGIIYIKLKRFSPKVNFSRRPGAVQANASCDIVLDVTVKDANNKNLLTTTVGGSRSVDGDGGFFCGNGANVLSEAMSLAMVETMKRYAEMLSNSEGIRRSFQQMNVIEREIR